MGMAASQARFLQLTARKNNDEYMGQQINQARTALANKSAGLFEKMLALQPPTPPSSMDDKYYKQGYGFTDIRDGVRKKLVWTPMDQAPETATVSVTRTYVNAAGVSVSVPITAQFSTADDILSMNVSVENGVATSGQITGLLEPLPEGCVKAVVRYADFEHTAYDPDGNYHTYTDQRPIVGYFDSEERLLNFQELTISPVAGYNSIAGDPDFYDPGSVGPPLVRATHNERQADGSLLPVPDGRAPTEDNLVFHAVAGESPIDMAYQNLEDGTGFTTRDLTYNGQFDDVQFQQDMDRYEFEKNAYDYQIERINLETKQIQQQDKSMELKLKQIDTDHQAIQTEMEAVSKVITKNIESTFKTFA